nr:uncharacterized protein LOC123745178 [Procambarus clarkii]
MGHTQTMCWLAAVCTIIAADDALHISVTSPPETVSPADTEPRLLRRVLDPPGISAPRTEHRASPDGSVVLVESEGGRQASLIEEDGNIQYSSLNKGDDTYEFGYDTRGGRTGARFFRHEEKGADGRVRGQYGFVDANDDLHVVVYVTDALGHRIRTETHKIEGYGKELSKILEKGASSADVKDQINLILKEQSSSSPRPRITSTTLGTISQTSATTTRPLTTPRSIHRSTRGTQIPTGPEPYFDDEDDSEPSATSPRPSTTRTHPNTLPGGRPGSRFTASSALQGGKPVFPLGFDDTDGHLRDTSPSLAEVELVSAPAPAATHPPAVFSGSDNSVLLGTPSPAQNDERFSQAFQSSLDSMFSTRATPGIATSPPGLPSPTRTSAFHTPSSSGHPTANSNPETQQQRSQEPQTLPLGQVSNTTPLSVTIPLRDSLSAEEYQELQDYLNRILRSGTSPLGDMVLRKLDLRDMGVELNGDLNSSLGEVQGGGGGLAVFVNQDMINSDIIDGDIIDGDIIDGDIIDGDIINGDIIDGGIIDGGIIGASGDNFGRSLERDIIDGMKDSSGDNFGRSLDMLDGASVNSGIIGSSGFTLGDIMGAANRAVNRGKTLGSDIIDGDIINGGIINIETLTGSELAIIANNNRNKNLFHNDDSTVNDGSMNRDTVDDSSINQDTVDDSSINQDTVDDSSINQDTVDDSSINQDTVDDSRINLDTVDDRSISLDTTSLRHIRKSFEPTDRRKSFSDPDLSSQMLITGRRPSVIDQIIAFRKPNYPDNFDQRSSFVGITNAVVGGGGRPEAIHYMPSPDLTTGRPPPPEHNSSPSSHVSDPRVEVSSARSSEKDFETRQVRDNSNIGNYDPSWTRNNDFDIRQNFDNTGQHDNKASNSIQNTYRQIDNISQDNSSSAIQVDHSSVQETFNVNVSLRNSDQPSVLSGAASSKNVDNSDQTVYFPAPSPQNNLKSSSDKSISGTSRQNNYIQDRSPQNDSGPRINAIDDNRGEFSTFTASQNTYNARDNVSDVSNQENQVPGAASGKGFTTIPDDRSTFSLLSSENQPDRSERIGTPLKSRRPTINLVRPINSDYQIQSNSSLRPVTGSFVSPGHSPVQIDSTITTTTLTNMLDFVDHHPHIDQQDLNTQPFPGPPPSFPGADGSQPPQIHNDMTVKNLPNEEEGRVIVAMKPGDSEVTASSVRAQEAHREAKNSIGLMSLGDSGHLPFAPSLPEPSTYASVPYEVTKTESAPLQRPSQQYISVSSPLKQPFTLPPPPQAAPLPTSHGSSLPPHHISTLPPPHVSAPTPPHGHISHKSRVTTLLPLHGINHSPGHGSRNAPPHGPTTPSSPPRGLTTEPIFSPVLGDFPSPPHRFDLGSPPSLSHSRSPLDLPHSLPPEDVVPFLHHGPPLIPTHPSIIYPGRVSYQELKFTTYPSQRRSGRAAARFSDISSRHR